MGHRLPDWSHHKRFHTMSCRLFLDDLSFNRTGLGDIRKIRIVVECCRDPDTAGFDMAMIGTGLSGIGYVAAVSKSVLQVIEQGFLTGGNCESCKKPAPFVKPGGDFYLEVHHLRRLVDGGSDTVTNAVAVCPNCHRELHYGNERDCIEKSLCKLEQVGESDLDVTYRINSNVTTRLNPTMGSWQEFLVCDLSGNVIGVSVTANDEVMVFFTGGEWTGNFVTNKAEGYNFINRDNDWKGFLVPTSNGGYVRGGPHESDSREDSVCGFCNIMSMRQEK